MKRHTLVPFRFPFHIAIGDEWPTLMRRLGIEDDDDPREHADARTYYNPGVTPTRLGVWIHDGCHHATIPEVAGVLAHEADHVVDYIWEAIGEDGSPAELHAYYVGHVTELLMAAVLDGRSQT